MLAYERSKAHLRKDVLMTPIAPATDTGRMPIYEVTSARGKVLYSGWSAERAAKQLEKHTTATGKLHTYTEAGEPLEPITLNR